MNQVIVMTAFCLFLSLGRVWYTDSSEYLFMNWNLFLALVPLILSWFLEAYENIYPRILLVFVIFAWLLFFPNGPYLITDLMHLRDHKKSPLLWYDLIMFFSYAHLGLHVAIESAKHIEVVLTRYVQRIIAQLVMSLLFFAVAFGVYLGRFLRFNSWDLFYKPLNILTNIADCFDNPIENSKSYAMTAFFGLMLNVIYFAKGRMNGLQKVPNNTD